MYLQLRHRRRLHLPQFGAEHQRHTHQDGCVQHLPAHLCAGLQLRPKRGVRMLWSPANYMLAVCSRCLPVYLARCTPSCCRGCICMCASHVHPLRYLVGPVVVTGKSNAVRAARTGRCKGSKRATDLRGFARYGQQSMLHACAGSRAYRGEQRRQGLPGWLVQPPRHAADLEHIL